jgi:hypothetical protein
MVRLVRKEPCAIVDQEIEHMRAHLHNPSSSYVDMGAPLSKRRKLIVDDAAARALDVRMPRPDSQVWGDCDHMDHDDVSPARIDIALAPLCQKAYTHSADIFKGVEKSAPFQAGLKQAHSAHRAMRQRSAATRSALAD